MAHTVWAKTEKLKIFVGKFGLKLKQDQVVFFHLCEFKMNFYNLKLSSSTPASKTEADSGPIHFRPKAESF